MYVTKKRQTAHAHINYIMSQQVTIRINLFNLSVRVVGQPSRLTNKFIKRVRFELRTRYVKTSKGQHAIRLSETV